MAVSTLEQQSLDWIERAPFTATGRAITTASPEAVFAVLADHERWPEWFPKVKRVEIIGPADGVGAQRRVFIPGAQVEEIFIAWEPGERWSFTGTGAKPKLFRALVEDCRLTSLGDGGAAISYSMYIEPVPWLRPVMKLVAKSLTKNLDRAMRALAARAEGR